MCYHCATNPSIHHHCHHVMAMLLLLSHHGVAFMSVAVLSLPSVSPSLLHCCGVIVTVVSLWCLCCHIVTVSLLPSQCHLHHHIVAILSLPSWCRLHICHSFVVTIVVSPSCWSPFHCCCRGVTFTSVTVLSLPLWCHLHVGCSFVIAIVVLPSSSHHCGVVVTVASLWFLFCHIVAVSLSPSWCCLRRHIVTVSSLSRYCLHHCIVTVSSSQFRCCHCGVVFTLVTVSSLPLQCRLC